MADVGLSTRLAQTRRGAVLVVAAVLFALASEAGARTHRPTVRCPVPKGWRVFARDKQVVVGPDAAGALRALRA